MAFRKKYSVKEINLIVKHVKKNCPKFKTYDKKIGRVNCSMGDNVNPRSCRTCRYNPETKKYFSKFEPKASVAVTR